MKKKLCLILFSSIIMILGINSVNAKVSVMENTESSVISNTHSDTTENFKNNVVQIEYTFPNAGVAKVLDAEITEDAECNIISNDLRKFLQTILDYIRIFGVIFAIILGIIDYIKVIFGSDEKIISKANKNFATRIIAVGLLFLVPSLLNFILALFPVLGIGDTGTCGVN